MRFCLHIEFRECFFSIDDKKMKVKVKGNDANATCDINWKRLENVNPEKAGEETGILSAPPFHPEKLFPKCLNRGLQSSDFSLRPTKSTWTLPILRFFANAPVLFNENDKNWQKKQ